MGASKCMEPDTAQEKPADAPTGLERVSLDCLLSMVGAPATPSQFDSAVADVRRRLQQGAEDTARLAAVRAIMDEQAKDEGLWFQAPHASEAYLQQELRRLHEAIEGKTQEQCAREAIDAARKGEA